MPSEPAVETFMDDRVGRFALVLELARGGMGVVHLARALGHAGFDKLVVLKELKPALALDPELQMMFLDEARLAARLSHRNIVQTYEVGAERGRYFMALEYLEGCTLRALQKSTSDGALPAALAVRVAMEALAGLHHAHELRDFDGAPLGVVHRDVTPQNIFLTFDGQVKLLDFGVATAVDRHQVTHCGVLKGCIPYVSPEHASGATIDRRADVFSVGIVLREALSGERLWQDASENTTLQRLLRREIPSFDNDLVPAPLRAICEKAMAPDPRDRFATAEDMRTALEEWTRSLDGDGSLTALGALVTEKFSSERERIRAVVRAHARSTSASDSQEDHKNDEDGPATRVERSDVSAAVITQRMIDARRTPARMLRNALMMVGAVAVGAGVALWVSGRAVPQRDVAAQVGLAVSPSTPEPTFVDVAIKATPADAAIFVDDALVGHGAWSSRVKRGAKVDRVRVSAAGYLDVTHELTYSSNENLTFQLARAPQPSTARRELAAPKAAAPRTPASVSPPVSVAVPPSEPAPRPAKIDKRNPYVE